MSSPVNQAVVPAPSRSDLEPFAVECEAVRRGCIQAGSVRASGSELTKHGIYLSFLSDALLSVFYLPMIELCISEMLCN